MDSEPRSKYFLKVLLPPPSLMVSAEFVPDTNTQRLGVGFECNLGDKSYVLQVLISDKTCRRCTSYNLDYERNWLNHPL